MIGDRGRQRVLSEHTSSKRAEEFERCVANATNGSNEQSRVANSIAIRDNSHPEYQPIS
jgi:hypothetical protein